MAMKVYLYSRVSTSEQTLEQQERTAMEWLNSNHLKIDDVISDEGVSGGVSYADRNLGKVLIPKLQKGDLLIVSEISRLGRSMYDLSKLINTELKERGVRLVIVSMCIDLRCDNLSAIDELILNNFAFAAQLEKQLIKERTTSAMRVKMRQGIKIGRANDNYKIDERNQVQGRIKASITRLNKTLQSDDFNSFCRIMKRTYKALQDSDDLLSFSGKKYEVLQETDDDKLSGIISMMRYAKEDNKNLFKDYNLTTDDLETRKRVRAKIHNTFRTISTYVANKTLNN